MCHVSYLTVTSITLLTQTALQQKKIPEFLPGSCQQHRNITCLAHRSATSFCPTLHPVELQTWRGPTEVPSWPFPLCTRRSVSLTFSKLYANLYHCHADCTGFHQLKDSTSPLKRCLHGKGWWIKTGRASYLCWYSCCLSVRSPHSSTKTLGQKNQTKNYIQDHVLLSAALSLCSYCICVLSVGDACATDKLPVLPSFDPFCSPWKTVDLTSLRHLTVPHIAYIRPSTFMVFQTKFTVYFILLSETTSLICITLPLHIIV